MSGLRVAVMLVLAAVALAGAWAAVRAGNPLLALLVGVGTGVAVAALRRAQEPS